ncbi:hypothetical protein JAAARDRAFT_184263 [Jaapia argillacea MUCL 33604]|uniref:F-box domain-containing protein n=1 Tax=Jaapia argillacea MUCL 33604 TaxID=933084 RepID=A0A067PPX3_9AGAM|nr:hypothetical protein JAAARDRAFT_184263 [Jaapia argillacea MUCL 33604]
MSEEPIVHPSLLSSSLDILPLVFAHLDRPTLLSASQANKTFNTFSNKLLYSSVILSPEWRNPAYPRKDEGLLQCQFQSALKPHISPHVQRLTITGHLGSYSSVPTTLLSSLHTSILSFASLQSLSITPTDHLPDQFVPLLLGLANGSLQRLSELEVNTSCFVESGEFEYRPRVPLGGAIMEEDEDEDRVEEERNREAETKKESKVEILIRIQGLTSLTLVDPKGTIIQSLPTWLTHLSPTLREFHLKGNCGSITPGILRSLSTSLLTLHQPLRSFSIGISYSLTDTDIFGFLDGSPNGPMRELEELTVCYYMQLKPPTVIPNLPSLRKLTIKHTGTPISCTTQASLFTSFILRLIKKSRCLRELNIIHDGVGGGVKMDGLVSSLVAREGRGVELREVRLWFVGRAAFEELCRSCTSLEVLVAGVSPGTFRDLPTLIAPLKRLHKLSLKTHFVKQSKQSNLFNTEAARDLMSTSRVQRLSVDGGAWEGRWEVCEGKVEFSVVEVGKAGEQWGC